MKALGRYAGRKTVALAWTATVALAAAVLALEGRPLWEGGPMPAAVTLGVWVAGLAGFSYRARRQWRRMAADGQFESQTNDGGTYPALQGTVRGRTVTVEATAPGFLADVHTHVETSVDGVDARVALRARYVGGDAGARGHEVGNPTIDEKFVFEGATPAVMGTVLTPEVQSVLMDLDVPGDLVITNRAVAYDVPFAHLSPAQLRRCANAVATVAIGVEELAE